jgi:hypothetical protein
MCLHCWSLSPYALICIWSLRSPSSCSATFLRDATACRVKDRWQNRKKQGGEYKNVKCVSSKKNNHARIQITDPSPHLSDLFMTFSIALHFMYCIKKTMTSRLKPSKIRRSKDKEIPFKLMKLFRKCNDSTLKSKDYCISTLRVTIATMDALISTKMTNWQACKWNLQRCASDICDGRFIWIPLLQVNVQYRNQTVDANKLLLRFGLHKYFFVTRPKHCTQW